MKVKFTRKRLVGALLLSAIIVFFMNCNVRKNPTVSDDASALSGLIKLNMKYNTARWEIFQYPDQSHLSLAIGPTDYVNLIAELTPLDSEAFNSLPPGEEAHIKVGSSRPWLNREFKTLLEKGESSSFNLSGDSKCRPLDATLRKSNKLVSGIICRSGDKAVVLLFLSVAT